MTAPLPAGWARVWPPALAVVVVTAVGAPAAVASYRHARDVVAATGDPVMAPWLPLSVDGMLLAALVVIWVRRHRGDQAGAGPWAAFLFGMVVTILANLAAVQEATVRAVAVALFPPIALAVTLELVALIAHRTRPAGAREEPLTVGDAVAQQEEIPPAAADPEPAEPTTEPTGIAVVTPAAPDEPETLADLYPGRDGESKTDHTRRILLAEWAEGRDPSGGEVDAVTGGSSLGRAQIRKLKDEGYGPGVRRPTLVSAV